MKKYSFLVKTVLMSIVTAVSVSLASCSDDDDLVVNSNMMDEPETAMTRGGGAAIDAFKPNADHSQWMAALSDSRLVADLSLPGTHNACTAEGWHLATQMGKATATTQDLTIDEQLKVGVRVFDLRPERVLSTRNATYELRCCHGVMQTELTVKDFFGRGEVTDSVSVTDMGISKSDARACDPEVMEQVMRYAYGKYAATRDYGLVLWGHGTGWLMEQEVSATRAYGLDNGKYIGGSGKWINVPTLKNILQKMPHMKFIMCDCCHMMDLEDLYELRHVTDYMIGSPAEIPGQGAPYDTMLPALFEKEMFFSSIIERYHASVRGALPMAAVKMSEMDNVAQATIQAMQGVKANLGGGYADMTGIIHYGYDDNGSEHLDAHNFYYDAGDFMSRYASAADYQMWNEALAKAVVMKRIGYKWDTIKKWDKFYADFEMTEEKFHGVSMFVPQSPTTGNYKRYNNDINQMEWFKLLAPDF